jgi:hypothetical protein
LNAKNSKSLEDMSIKYAIALVLDDYRIEFNKVEDDRIAALKTPQSYAFERGIKSRSGKQKTTDAIKKILANYFYAGYTTSKLSDKMNKGLHEALVSLEVIKKRAPAFGECAKRERR